MSNSDNYLKILEKISEVREGVSVLENEVKHIKDDMSDTKRELFAIQQQDLKQNQLLAEHIQGVQTAQARLNLEIETRKQERELIEKQIADLDDRLKKAEFLPRLADQVRTAIIWIGGIATAVVAIAKLLKLF